MEHDQLQYLTTNWNSLTDQQLQGQQMLSDLLEAYAAPDRHYHNRHHIEAMLRLVDEQENLLQNPTVIRLAVWYHDAVYRTSRTDNEEQSAVLAERQLPALGFSASDTETCANLIRATKSHQLDGSLAGFDGAFFLDCDLAILGKPWEQYELYTRQIRKEYRKYPNLIYKPGRRKVLRHFLELPRIYKTDLFRDHWEAQARRNLEAELATL